MAPPVQSSTPPARAMRSPAPWRRRSIAAPIGRGAIAEGVAAGSLACTARGRTAGAARRWPRYASAWPRQWRRRLMRARPCWTDSHTATAPEAAQRSARRRPLAQRIRTGITAAAAAALSDSMPPCIGIVTRCVACAASAGDSPAPSLPIASAMRVPSGAANKDVPPAATVATTSPPVARNPAAHAGRSTSS